MKYIHPNSADGLSKKHKVIFITIGLSLLLHIILVVKTGLPFNLYQSVRNEPIQVKIVNGSSNSSVNESIYPKNVLEEKLDSTLPEKLLKRQTTIPQIKTSNQAIAEPSVAIPESSQPEKITDDKQIQTFIDENQLIPANEVNINLIVVSVNDGKILGQAQQHFTSDGRDSYKLMFTSNSIDENNPSEPEHSNDYWSYEINGRVFGNQLSPSLYAVRGVLAERLFFLSRETNNEIPVTETPTSGSMPDGILDRQSLIYYFMFRPPKDFDTQLSLSDGAKNSTYKVHVAGIELVNSDYFGKIRVVHMLMSNLDSHESIELWLAPTLKHLPIKVRYTSGQGIITDLVASLITIK
ncbi:MAG: DUF3108 domain-containing protein [Methylophilaceae bacterium]|nr:DUF3108 domain-containing protein [Methyloradius sp.]